MSSIIWGTRQEHRQSRSVLKMLFLQTFKTKGNNQAIALKVQEYG
jgi:hypothetical protein